ncbi:MAG: tail fiber domain-containing protein [Bacteriovorax sp.]|nr:tail fiber domain-containing protein [Bacteriovorax sp.]
MVEILVAVGMLAGLTLVSMNLAKQATSTQKKLETDIEADFITREITGILSDPLKCTPLLAGFNAASTAAGAILNINGKYAASLTTGYGASQLKVDSYLISNSGFSEITDTNTETSLVINFTMPKIISTTVPTMRARRIKLIITKSGANILTCKSAWVNSLDYWSKSGNNLFYSAGKIGIGISTPTEILEVGGNFAATTGKFNNDSGVTFVNISQHYVEANSGGVLAFNAERAAWHPTLNDSLGIISFQNGVNWNRAALIEAFAAENFDAVASGSYVTISTSPLGANIPSEVIRFTENAKVGIGTTTPSEKLHIVGNLRVQGSTDCTLGNGAGGTNCTSDIRLKKNIQEIKDSLEKILSLRGIEFEWNEKSQSPNKHAIGVIAQEVEKVFPTAVIEDLQSGYKKVDYAVLVAPLIQAFKKLYNEITTIKNENSKNEEIIAGFKDKIKKIELKNASLEERLLRMEKLINKHE